MIDKKIHIVWVGDETRRPDACIDSWKKANPDYEVRIWGNDDLRFRRWINARHIRDMWDRELCGVADLMRYEILYSEGGMAIDADAACLRPLEDWVIEPDDFASYSNELAMPGMVTNAFMGARPGSPFIGALIAHLAEQPTVVDRRAWQSTGPTLVTQMWHHTLYPLTVWPAHLFTPRHHSGWAYTGSGPVFGHQLFGSTQDSYEAVNDLRSTEDAALAAAMPTHAPETPAAPAAAPAHSSPSPSSPSGRYLSIDPDALDPQA